MQAVLGEKEEPYPILPVRYAYKENLRCCILATKQKISTFVHKQSESPMNIEDIREYCLQKSHTDEAFPFDDTTLVFRVMGKIFACFDLNNPSLVVLKCAPDYALELREHYDGIEGAWHWNKKHWNQIHLDRDVPDSLLRTLIDHSYEEVYKKIPRKIREQVRQLAG